MIYAIGDLHLDSTGDKSMAVFGEHWRNHQNKIKEHWLQNVAENDLVLIPGDISWAMKLQDAYLDLRFIDSLPGDKILLKGNHDYWWQSLTKVNDLGLSTLKFLQNNAFVYNHTGIAGTRGWSDIDLKEHDDEHNKKIFRRELIRLELSLKELTKFDTTIKIAMIHYPPFNRHGEPNEFVALMKEYDIDICIYGHLHAGGHQYVREGIIEGIEFECVASDYLDFNPKLLIRRR